MDKDGLIQLVKTVTVDRLKIEGICRLRRYIHDPEVIDLLCREAVGTENQTVIHALVDTVKAAPEAAGRRFSHFALNAEKPAVRRRAFTWLKAIECRRAKEAVLQGLSDPHPSVRVAAAANLPLYCDPDIGPALERFLDCDRALLVFDLACEAASPFLPRIDRMGRIYSENCHAGSVQADKKRINGKTPRIRYWNGGGLRVGAVSRSKSETKRFYRFLQNPFPMQETARPPGDVPADRAGSGEIRESHPLC